MEVACPIYDGRVRDRIRHILEAQEYDTRKGRVLRPDGVYARSEQMGEPLDSQQLLMDEAERSQAPARRAAAGGPPAPEAAPAPHQGGVRPLNGKTPPPGR